MRRVSVESATRLAAHSPRATGFAIGLIVGAAYLGLRFQSLQGIGEAVDHSPGLMQDFSMYFYRTGKSLVAGTGPVGGFLYPPIFGILMMPLSFLSLPDARLVWGIFEGVSTLVLAGISARLAPGRVGWVAAITAATLISTPVLHNFKWGQIGVPLTVLGLIAVEVVVSRPRLSVSLMSLASAIKVYPAVLFSVLVRRLDWRALVAGVGCVATLVLGVPGLVLGERRTRKFFEKVAPFLGATADTTDPNSQSLSHWLTRTFGAPPEWLVPALAVLLALGTVALLWRARASEGRELDGFTAFLALAFIPFVVPTCWANYFAFLPPLAAFLASRADDLKTPFARSLTRGIAAIVLLASSFLAVDALSGWENYVRDGVLLLADLLAASTMLGLLAFRPRPDSDRVGDLLET